LKCCTLCGGEKSLDEFYRRSRSKDGRASRCIDCCKVLKKDYYAKNSEEIKRQVRDYYFEHSEERREYSRRYAQENKKVRAEKRKAYFEKNRKVLSEKARQRRLNDVEHYKYKEKLYRDKNSRKRAAQSRQWRIDDPEKNRLAKDRWKNNNYEKVLESARVCGSRRRARKMSATSVYFTGEQISQRWKYYGNKCYLCGAAAEQTDHVKPLAAGGANMLSNLRPICRKCNERKNDKWPYPVISRGFV